MEVVGGVVGVLIGSSAAILLRRRFAISIAAAVSCASLGCSRCSGGTTTDGPNDRSSKVVLIEESRRTPRRFSGGDSMSALESPRSKPVGLALVEAIVSSVRSWNN